VPRPVPCRAISRTDVTVVWQEGGHSDEGTHSPRWTFKLAQGNKAPTSSGIGILRELLGPASESMSRKPVAKPRECLNAPILRDRGRLNASGLVAGGLVLVHGLAVRAERVALVDPFAGGADGVAAAGGVSLIMRAPCLPGRCGPCRPGQVQGLRRAGLAPACRLWRGRAWRGELTASSRGSGADMWSDGRRKLNRWPLRPEAKSRRGLPAPQRAWPAAERPCVSADVHRCRWRLSLTSSLGRSRAGRERLLSPHAFQVCGSVFTVGRRRLRPAVAWPRVTKRTRADVAE